MERLFLPYAERALIVACNALFLARPEGMRRLGVEEWRFSLHPPSFPARWRAWASFRWGEARVLAFADGVPPTVDLFPGVPAALVPELPPVLLAAGLEAWLGPALDAFASLPGGPGAPLILEEAGAGAKEAEYAGDMVGFTVTRMPDGAAVRGALAFTPDAASLLRDLAGALPAALPEAREDPLLRASLEAGLCFLTPAELASLRPGDIVFPDEYFPRGLGGPRLSLGQAAGGAVHFICRADGPVLTLKGWHMSETTQAADAPPPQNEAQDSGPLPEERIDDLSVQVVLELDSLLLPLGTVKAMREGYVLETGKSTDSPVTIRVSGRAVGTGELLDVNGRVGVRIRRMNGE